MCVCMCSHAYRPRHDMHTLHINIFIHMHMHTHIYNRYTHKHIDIFSTCSQTQKYICIHTNIFAHVCICTYTHIDTCIGA